MKTNQPKPLTPITTVELDTVMGGHGHHHHKHGHHGGARATACAGGACATACAR